jgi:uncharacterized protein
MYLHETLKIKWISQNFIFEDMELSKEDLAELARQMELCADYVKRHKNDLYWSMLDKRYLTSKPFDATNKTGWCGSGMMPALATDGRIYPCFRWLPHTQPAGREIKAVGDVFKGLYNKAIFSEIAGQDRTKISDQKCKDCLVESSCAWCIAGGYSETGGYCRQTHICEPHKINVIWARRYWNE